MKKKALEWDLKTIILVLIIFIVMFYLTRNIATYFTDSGSSQTCLLSVIATSKTRGSPTDALGLECETQFVGDLKVRGTTTEQKKDYVMKQIADLNYECWMQFGEGKYDVFSGQQTQKTAHCFICSKFNMAGNSITSSEYIEFLKENNLGSKKSYYTFLYNGMIKEMENKGTEEEPELVPKSDKPSIFIKSMSFAKLESSKFWGIFFSAATSLATLNFDALMDYLYTNTEHTTFDELKQNEDYAIIYFQISDEYWKQTWLTKGGLHLIDKSLEQISFDYYEKRTPPARIMISNYSGIINLGCDMLQG